MNTVDKLFAVTALRAALKPFVEGKYPSEHNLADWAALDAKAKRAAQLLREQWDKELRGLADKQDAFIDDLADRVAEAIKEASRLREEAALWKERVASLQHDFDATVDVPCPHCGQRP